jgi:hypothetical protein
VDVGGAAGCCVVFDDAGDLGDDVAAAFDGDEVADADAETGDFVGVMERGAGDGGAADEDGSRSATGVTLPVRPTWKRTPLSWVMPARAANL